MGFVVKKRGVEELALALEHPVASPENFFEIVTRRLCKRGLAWLLHFIAPAEQTCPLGEGPYHMKCDGRLLLMYDDKSLLGPFPLLYWICRAHAFHFQYSLNGGPCEHPECGIVVTLLLAPNFPISEAFDYIVDANVAARRNPAAPKWMLDWVTTATTAIGRRLDQFFKLDAPRGRPRKQN